MATLPWKPWHKVLTLREDLRSGELPLHLFAADLYEVVMQRGQQPTYEDPVQFFSLTFPTYNLRELSRDVCLRLAGKNDKAVRQLELTYGGGKTHALITLRHLVHDPERLPDLPAVADFIEQIGQKPPRCRVAALCFDKLDVEKGMEVRSPEGKVRTLKEPWSILGYELAGDEGLKLLHAEERAEERSTAPAEELLRKLLEVPAKENLGTIILIDEVLMYAREKATKDRNSRAHLANFFQYLTQAATKAPRCCIVASLLATDPNKSDELGRKIQSELYEIFRREREQVVEPVVKEDVAEVLRRRFFTPDSLKGGTESFRQHVVAALKGIRDADEQTARHGAEAEERFLKSFPFHPDLTEVLYSKWTQLSQFQRTRGVLRTFALALREAEQWGDPSPLVGPGVFLRDPQREGLSDGLQELVGAADSEEWEGRKQSWRPILDVELEKAAEIERDSVGLKHREIEQAVVATFLHSQPIGQSQNARTRDLTVLIAPTRVDRIELEKGLTRWARASFWLDDRYSGALDSGLPGTWRLGNRPNLNQMHAAALKGVSDQVVLSRLTDEIGKVKLLAANVQGSGVRLHLLPKGPRDVEDDGRFHYAVLGPSAASESGKPSPEAVRYLDETTGPDKPRVSRNALLLLAPSKDGIELAIGCVRNYLAWESVREDLKQQQKSGSVDPARFETLNINSDTEKGRMGQAIRQAYCIVVTVSEKNEAQAFKITVTDEPHFAIVKADRRARLQDTAITAEALLPGGPYDLWKAGETARRVKDLSSAFAQFPHLPKMLQTGAITETLASGCERGSFVLRLRRPDDTHRTWWMTRPDDTALNDASLELVLNEAAVLVDLSPALLAPRRLPELWSSEDMTVESILAYFGGGTAVQVDRDGYKEPIVIPKASRETIERAIASAVEQGIVWLISGPASVLGEPIPAGILNETSQISAPPSLIPAGAILPAGLPSAWSNNRTTGLSVLTALSSRVSKNLPWKTVREVIGSALQARFLEVAEDSGPWPCDLPSAAKLILTVAPRSSSASQPESQTNVYSASAELQLSELQDLGELVPELSAIKARRTLPIRFRLEVELGDGAERPKPDEVAELNAVLKKVRDDLQLNIRY